MSIFGFNKRRVLNKVSQFVTLTKGLSAPGASPYSVDGSQYYVFTGSGTVDASSPNPASITYNSRSGIISSVSNDASVDVLIVAGGGGSANTQYHGGGGGGGMIFGENLAIPATSHPITIGGGGGTHSNGSNTQFGTFATAIGGGGGTHDEGPASNPGGSGGGGAFRPNNFRPANPGGSGVQPSQPGISGQYGYGNPGHPAPPHGDQGGNGGGSGAQNGSSTNVPTSFLPTNFPSPFLGAPSGNPSTWRAFAGGGSGSQYGTSSSINSSSYPGRGNGGGGSGAPGVIIIKVR